MRIFINQLSPEPAVNQYLDDTLKQLGHTVLIPANLTHSNLAAAAHDPLINQADVAFGQPDPESLLHAPNLHWVHLTSAGYDRYDRPDIRAAFKARGAILTNSSAVYDEPCAQHVVAMMLSLSRQLPWSHDNQRDDQAWPAAPTRKAQFLLQGQTALLLSYGAIARRVVELLEPFGMKLIAMRRHPSQDEPIQIIIESQLDQFLPHADHVLNILPGGAPTRHFINAARLAQFKRGAYFYNIGRGTTVDQAALADALKARHVQAAYLDVTDPEPLPPENSLWRAPNCHITPHTAGGHANEFQRLADHFLSNLKAIASGASPKNVVF